jgi:threonine aldolase
MQNNFIDFRSDTITQPTDAMKNFMFQASVGDDVFGEDPTINLLEKETALRFGKEAALFCPSGTMTNQIAIAVHTNPRDEVICHQHSHIYLYEGGGPAWLSSVSLRLLDAPYGIITADQIEENINAENVHFPRTTLVSLENSMNKGGGACYSLSELQKIKNLCKKHQLSLHLDGARVFNACVAMGYSPMDMGNIFDSISICFSKGLGAPVGSVLVGSNEFIHEARRVRKVLGGGMRQAGFLAAGALYALRNHVDRLSIDHTRAKELSQVIENQTWVSSIFPVETNIIVFEVKPEIGGQKCLQLLNQAGIQASGFGKNFIRLVYHLDITEIQHENAKKIMMNLL